MTWNMQRMIKEKGLYLDIDIPEDLPPVLADYELLDMIVKQLIDNAYRYTEEGGITITAVPIDGFVQVNVTDTGPGIRPENYERVFERFVRGTEPGQGVDSQERGIGLGLSIVKHLVEHHEGHVWVTSEPGQGSTLSFTLRQADVVGTPEEQGRAFGTAA
jgi:two-component system phosphate regulon sensor histidine kinase PhoR